MDKALSVVPAESTYILPIPSKTSSLFQRQYSPAFEFAYAISKATRITINNTALSFTRTVKKQSRLKKAARLHNLNGAFKVNPLLKGKSVLLVDDIVTTGATLEAAKNALQEAGVLISGSVSVAARVLGYFDNEASI